MNILILGASGMLGNAMMRVMSERTDWHVQGTIRSERSRRYFEPDIARRLIPGIDVEQADALVSVFAAGKPDIVINCVGLVKQLSDAKDPLRAVPINTLLPHRLAALCKLSGARLIHMSTDCVFSGEQGRYRESDRADADDLYGRSKLLGEVDDPHAVTLRTSIIGHELESAHGLVNWFLAQQVSCRGFTRAIFSGLPTAVLAQVVRDIVIPRPDLHGVYHVASAPVSKYDLLRMIAAEYGKDIAIEPCDTLVIDRSLDASRFRAATGYVAPDWTTLIQTMHAYR